MVRASLKPGTLIFLTVFLAGFTFAAVTQRGWEDYWITFRASRNLATGQGLVFTSGERVQTFTSPLGVLLPAGLSWLTGNGSEQLILWLFRLVSLAALAAGVATMFSVLKHLGLRRPAIGLALALVVLDSKTLDFSTNGMETGLLLGFLALTLHGMLVSGRGQVWRTGLGWGGLMWTRPDSCIYIAALSAGFLLFMRARRTDSPPDNPWRKLLGAGLICALVYLPWFAWAWWYYGSPVPNTIVAKGTNLAPLTVTGLVENFLWFPFQCLLHFGASLWWTYLPAYSWTQTWPILPTGVSMVAGWVAALVWLCPLCRPAARLLSVCVFAGHFFLSNVVRNFYPWYLPLLTCLASLTLGMVFDQLLGLAARFPQLGWDRGWFRRPVPVLFAAGAALVAAQGFLAVGAAREAQMQQRLIEDSIRRPIGLWLHDHAASPADTVMLEPLGYIGYFSGLKMFDYPGLCSREMVAARARLGPERDGEAYLELKPDWIVLRPDEAAGKSYLDATHLSELYEVVAVFDAMNDINAVRWLPAREHLLHDGKFLIYHRKAAPKAAGGR